jgi:hypothetical protein
MKFENSVAEKKDMITMFRAVIVQNGKEVLFSNSSNTILGLNKLLNKHGMKIQDVKRIETFLEREEKQRGRAARKY